MPTENTDTARRCPRCKTPIHRTRIGTSEGLVSGLTCWACGWWQDIDDPRRYMQRPAPQRLDERVPCKVQGCINLVQVNVTVTGFCHVCNRLLRDYETSAKRRPAPIIEVLGKYIFNPERLKK